jgi:hypothetical protein
MGQDAQNQTNGEVWNATLCRWEPLVITAAQAERVRVHQTFLALVRAEMVHFALA